MVLLNSTTHNNRILAKSLVIMQKKGYLSDFFDRKEHHIQANVNDFIGGEKMARF